MGCERWPRRQRRAGSGDYLGARGNTEMAADRSYLWARTPLRAGDAKPTRTLDMAARCELASTAPRASKGAAQRVERPLAVFVGGRRAAQRAL